MRISILASGSNGNSTFIETDGFKFLIDNGISLKNLTARFQECGCDINDINSVFITHEHHDHVAGLKVMLKRMNVDCYLTKGTYENLNSETRSILETQNIKIVKADDVLEFGKCKIHILNTHHDSKEAIGFLIEENGKKLVYITDTGYVDQVYYPLLKNADMYVMESNYDVELLWSSGRPFELKKRIDGDYGHMSNETSAVLLGRLIGANTKRVVLAHISDDCNYYHMPELIKNTHKKIYNELGLNMDSFELICASRNGVTGVYEI